jgi:hypothetical protein
MIALKQVLLVVALSATVTLGSTGTASAVGTHAYRPDVLAKISKVHNWQPVDKSKNVGPAKPAAVTPLPQAPVPTPAPTPAPVVIDPNGCEARGLHYRADNNECIPNPAPAAPAPQAAAPIPTGGADCELARSLINQYSDWNHDVAFAVMKQESGCNPLAANWNDNHGSCVGSFGLFQVSCLNGQLYDPGENVRQAFAMWRQSGWQPWSFTTCKIVSCF